MGQMRVRRTGPWVKISCPFSWVQFIPRVGHGVGQAVDPHFGPHLKVHFYNEKHLKSEDFRCFLSGGFNPDIFASEALHCNGLQISNKKYSQFF